MSRPLLLAAALLAALGCAAPPTRPATRPRRTAAPAPAPQRPAGPGPITAANWRTHPSLEAVRRLVAEGDQAVAARRWTPTKSVVCAPERSPRGYGLERSVFMDERGRVRRYVLAEGDDASTSRLEQLHDEAGRLRYAVGSLGAMSGASLKVTVFLAEDGAVLWTDRVRSGPAHPFPEAWPEDALVRDPSKDFVAPGPKGCRGR